jgi:hypothetical protein
VTRTFTFTPDELGRVLLEHLIRIGEVKPTNAHRLMRVLVPAPPVSGGPSQEVIVILWEKE